MEGGLIERSFDIAVGPVSYPGKFVIPAWAQGFECQVGVCGKCCLTEKPSDVPEVYNAKIDKGICGFYDFRRKSCLRYSNRPLGCRLYPFFFGVEEGEVIISKSLECPGTLSQESLLEIFSDPALHQTIAYLDVCYRKTFHHIEDRNRAKNLLTTITEAAQKSLHQRSRFPFLLDAIRPILDQKGAYSQTSLFSVVGLAKRMGGLYIATRFKSNYLCLAETNGLRAKMIVFDENLNELKTVKVRLPANFLDIEIDRKAQQLMHNYISFVSSLPFLSLAALLEHHSRIPVPNNVLGSLTSLFASIEIGATLIASRDKLRVIDFDIIREIISFSEPTTRNAFANPSRSIISI